MKRRGKGLLTDPVATLEQWMAPDPTDPNLGAVGSVMPGVSQQAISGLLQKNAGMATDVAMNSPMGLLGKIVYHGSPHSFDRFDMSKIGTGEGAQAYGHGLYFAENRNVAQQYQNMITANGRALKPGPFDAEFGAIDALNKAKGDYGAARKFLLDRQSSGGGDLAPELKSLEDMQRKGVKPDLGNLYKVDIPDEAIDKMLHWDKPLSEQPQAVRDALTAAGLKNADSKVMKGSGAYGMLSSKLRPAGTDNTSRDSVAAAQRLRELGIPGIKYLDQGSRAAQDGTHNYVLFDDALANIIGRE